MDKSKEVKPRDGEWWFCVSSITGGFCGQIANDRVVLHDSSYILLSDCEPVERLYTLSEAKQLFEETSEDGFKNGDKVVYKGSVFKFVSILSEEFHGTAVIYRESTEDLKQVPLSALSKPLSKEEIEKREVDDLYHYLDDPSQKGLDNARKLHALGIRVVDGELESIKEE